MKKIVKYGIGAVVVGGVTAGITIPVVNAANSKKDVIKHIDMTQEAWHGMTLKQLVDGVKQEEVVSGSILTEVSKAATFTMYDEEQKGSIALQEEHFEFKLYQIRTEIKELEHEKSAPTPPTAARVRQIDEKITSLNKDSKTVSDNKTKLTSLTKADYESSSFSTTFPHVLVTRDVIKDKQSKIFDDNKRAFVDQFTTEEEGKKAWIDELKKKYNGATNKKEAVAMIVYGIIKKDAYASHNYELNGTYTQEMMAATKEDNSTLVFPFLEHAEYKLLTHAGTSNTGTKNDKVYFIARKSKDPNKIAVDIDNTATGSILDDMASSNLIHLSHALIPAKQSTISSTLPWDITKEDLIGGAKGKSATGFISRYGASGTSFIESLDKLFDTPSLSTTPADEAQIEKDNFFIEHALSQPTAAKHGSLGVKEKIESIKGMAPGFKIGIVEALTAIKGGSTTTTEGDAIITKIITDIKQVMTDHHLSTQSQLVAYINSLSKEQVTNTFGGIFRDAFNGKPKLYYLLSDHSFIVRSSFGIHFIKIDDFSQATTLQAQIKKDLKNAAKDQGVSKVIINYTQLFAQAATTDKVVSELIKDGSPTEAALKAGYEKDKNLKTGEEMTTQFKKEADGTMTAMDWDEVKASIKEAINNVVASRTLNSAMSSLGTGIKKFLEEKLDADLIDPHDGSSTTTTITAEKIYNDAIELAKG